MYTEEELNGLRGQIARRRAVIIRPALLLAGAAIALSVIRSGLKADAVAALHAPTVMGSIRTCEILGTVSVLLTAAWLIFSVGMLLTPLRKYEQHLDELLHGRNHEITGIWAGVSGDVSEMDGVPSRAVGLMIKDDHGRDLERLLYWDVLKPMPEVEKGTEVSIVYHGRQVISMTPAEKKEA